MTRGPWPGDPGLILAVLGVILAILGRILAILGLILAPVASLLGPSAVWGHRAKPFLPAGVMRVGVVFGFRRLLLAVLS